MAQVNGLVEYKAPNKYGGFSIKVNGNFYNSKFEPKCEKGDVVTFDDGGKKYINALVVGGTASGATSAAPTPAATGKGSYRQNGMEGGFPIHPGAYERALDRRNALNAAVAYYSSIGVTNHTAEDIVEAARFFEAYTTGDMERIKVEKMFNAMSGED